jgi:hypothetical protein
LVLVFFHTNSVHFMFRFYLVLNRTRRNCFPPDAFRVAEVS